VSEQERLERAFKRKARMAYMTALLIVKSDPNGGANRIYYALFLALVSEYIRLGIQPELIDAGAAAAFRQDERLKWTHSFVKRNAKMLRLDARQCSWVRDAYDYRVVADYSDEDVTLSVIQPIVDAATDILECLGVNI